MYIQIDGVSKRFGTKPVLNRVSLVIEQGKFVVLLGPSGCGKTTLLGAIAGLFPLDEGSIAIAGRTLSQKGFTVEPEKRRIGMVFQDFALWPHMTVYDNVAFGLKVRQGERGPIRDKVAQALSVVRMTGLERRYPHELSGGQKQRVAIARAIAPEPTVLLMDEPLSNLDAKLRDDMRWELLSILQETGSTTVYVTHDQSEALSMADHLVLLNDGRVEQQGLPAQLYEQPASEFTASFLGPSNLIPGRVESRPETDARLETAAEPADARRETGDGPEEVDCGDFRLLAHGAPGERAVMVTIRPEDIGISRDSREIPGGKEPGSALWGSVLQRAYHGRRWHYKVKIDGPSGFVCEVWSALAFEPGERVNLSFPAARCRIVTQDRR